MARSVADNTVVVIGLGRFGAEVARTMMALGREVLAIEIDPDLVRRHAPHLTLVVEADATDVEVLRNLGVGEAEHAIVAIGTSIEASLLVTAALSDLGVQQIWAKAVTLAHQRILDKVGAHHVVFPELDMGNRIAHRVVNGGVRDYIDFANGYALSLVDCPRWLVGQSLAESGLTAKWRVSVVGMQRAGQEEFEVATGRSRPAGGDRLVIAGRKADVEAFTMRGEPPVRRRGNP